MACFPKRYTIAILAYFGFTFIMILQSGFSFAFLKMTEEDRLDFANGDSTAMESINFAHRVGFLFSFVGGIIAHRFGGATIIGTGVALSGFIHIMTPFTGYLRLRSLILIKFIDGLLQALAYSGMADIWARWYPLEERSKMVAFVLTGSYTSFLYHEHLSELMISKWGGRAIFSITGTAAVIWAILWLLLVRSDPTKDRGLSDNEKEVLAQRLNSIDTNRTAITASEWKQISRSVPVWTLCLATFVHSCGSIIIHKYLPNYAMSNGFMDELTQEKLPIIINIFIVAHLLVAGYLADYGRDRKFTATKIHKIFICTAFSICALLLVAYITVPRSLNIVSFFGLYDLFRSFGEVALYVNTIDLSPKYASFISGIQLSFLSLGEVLSSGFVNFALNHYQRAVWNFLFASFSVLYLFGAILYYYRGSGELQPWNTARVEVHELKRSKNDTAV